MMSRLSADICMAVSSSERNFVRLLADELFVPAEERLPHRLDPL
jgi:hypothetical protein